MDIGAIKTPTDFGGAANVAQKTPRAQAVVSALTANTGGTTAKAGATITDDKGNKKPAKLQDVQKTTEAMNQFFEAMNINIRFQIHQKTNELMVQVVEQANNKVIKEFPSHEFLDTIAAIRSYVGMLLDKKI